MKAIKIMCTCLNTEIFYLSHVTFTVFKIFQLIKKKFYIKYKDKYYIGLLIM